MERMTRDRNRRLKVSVTAEERRAIETRARDTGLSVSAYLRAVGMGHQPKSIFDQDAVLALVKVNADQGRLGGLLKLWLSDRPGEGVPAGDVRRLLREIEEAQAVLKRIAWRT